MAAPCCPPNRGLPKPADRPRVLSASFSRARVLVPHPRPLSPEPAAARPAVRAFNAPRAIAESLPSHHSVRGWWRADCWRPATPVRPASTGPRFPPRLRRFRPRHRRGEAHQDQDNWDWKLLSARSPNPQHGPTRPRWRRQHIDALSLRNRRARGNPASTSASSNGAGASGASTSSARDGSARRRIRWHRQGRSRLERACDVGLCDLAAANARLQQHSESSVTAALYHQLAFLGVELGDGFSHYGASYEDFIASAAGIALLVPEEHRSRPAREGGLPDEVSPDRSWRLLGLGDYSGKKFLLAWKLVGIRTVQGRAAPLSRNVYGLLHAGLHRDERAWRPQDPVGLCGAWVESNGVVVPRSRACATRNLRPLAGRC